MDPGEGLAACARILVPPLPSFVTSENLTLSLRSSIYNTQSGETDPRSSGLLSELNEILCANEKRVGDF